MLLNGIAIICQHKLELSNFSYLRSEKVWWQKQLLNICKKGHKSVTFIIVYEWERVKMKRRS